MNSVRIKILIRILLGIFFIVSGALKLSSIDSFEIYIYSLGFFNLSFSFLIARLVIAFELILGILLIWGIYFKQVFWITSASMLAFCLFLVSLVLKKETEHCHCFGDYLHMSHTASILKNIAILGAMSFIYRLKECNTKYAKLFLLTSIILGISLPFIISPPDSFYQDKYAKKSTYNLQKLDEYLTDNKINTDKKIICFLGASCRFCKLAAKKISTISEKTASAHLINYVFWGDSLNVENFFTETNTYKFKYTQLDGGHFLRITDGKMPLIVLLNDGKVIHNYGYRDIDEKEIIQFIENP